MWLKTKTLLASTLIALVCACSGSGDANIAASAPTSKELAQNPAVLHLTAPPQDVAAQAQYQSQAATAVFMPVTRIQNTTLFGAYFFTIYDTERAAALQANPNWRQEGTAFYASLTTDTGLSPVHRFRNLFNGSYLYTIYDAERAAIVANYSTTFVYEGVAWYARQTASTGWSPLYRFRNLVNGTYLFSAYESEKDAIVRDYPTTFALEGIAYYVWQSPTPPIVCTPPQVLTNGACVTPPTPVINIPTPAQPGVNVSMPQGIIPITCTNTNQACWVDMMNNGYVNTVMSGGKLYGGYRYISSVSGLLHHNLREIDPATGRLLNSEAIGASGSQESFYFPGRASNTPIIYGTNACYTYEGDPIACNSY
jgi:Repeat of unknown function (DUF5648)